MDSSAVPSMIRVCLVPRILSSFAIFFSFSKLRIHAYYEYVRSLNQQPGGGSYPSHVDLGLNCKKWKQYLLRKSTRYTQDEVVSSRFYTVFQVVEHRYVDTSFLFTLE